MGRSVLARSVIGALAIGASGCHIDAGTGKDAVGIVGAGIVNDPGNKSLRFDILRFGMDEFCRELLQSGAPLRLADDQPVIGRFFAETCETKTLDQAGRSTVLVQFGGKGFAWTAGTGRLGFRARGLLELAPDFRLAEGALYVYFRPVHVDTSDFSLLMTERPLARAVLQVAGVDEVAMGRAIIDAELGRGFTVIRYDADGHTDFGLGLLAPGEKPFRPFTVVTSPKRTVASGRTELYAGQQDFVGKIRVESNEAVTVTLHVEGVDAVDVALVPAKGETSLIERYVSSPGPLALPPDTSFLAQASAVAPFRSTVPVPSGDYYLVFDHTNHVGKTHPEKDALPARVDYLIQAGERAP